MRNTTSSLEAALRREGLLCASCGAEEPLRALSNHSGRTQAGDLFICKGFDFKEEYLLAAERRGAVAYMAERTVAACGLPCMLVSDVRKAQAVAARWYYDRPSDGLSLFGVTGTKGKTTTVHDLQAILTGGNGRPAGMLCGIACDVGGEREELHITTPESLEVQRLLRKAADNGREQVVVEVSSQAMKLDRLYGEHFAFGLFLSFGADHISPNEHPDLEDYLRCKLQLLRSCGTAIICRATHRFEDVCRAAKESAGRVLTVGAEGQGCDVEMFHVKHLFDGYMFHVRCNFREDVGVYRLRQAGRFNIDNALAAIAVGLCLGYRHEDMAAALETVTVPGRMHVIRGADKTVVVDYAHNALSVETLLTALRSDYPGAHLTVVTGSAGERDIRRRLDVGALCGRYADRCIFTEDDPGFEEAATICGHMADAAREAGGREVAVICHREQAIERAILAAPPGGVVVLAGKGQETTQRVRGEYVPYPSDAAVAERVLFVDKSNK